MFYIKKISLLTENNIVSDVDLKPGLNIIFGESNTGKSLILDCIDYMFGAKKHRFDVKLKIRQVTLVLDVDGKIITMRRDVDSNAIEVSSTVPGIESGDYKAGNAKKSIGYVWLYLMGIKDEVNILQTITGKKQKLTLRTFYHLLLLDETRLQGEASILASGQGVNRKVDTNVLTALLYFATGENYLPEEEQVDPKIRKAKREAVKAFVNRSMSAIESRASIEIENLSKELPSELQRKVDATIDEIGAVEGALEQASKKSAEYAEKIYAIDGQIAESRMLRNRNESLMTQYESDIRRLTFIAEGDIHSDELPKLETCPFCNGRLSKTQGESCMEAAIAEVQKIETQIRDLTSVQEALNKEIEGLVKEREAVMEERHRVDIQIRRDLKSQIAELRSQLADYTLALNQYKAKEMIDAFSNVLISELKVAEAEDKPSVFHFDLNGKMEEVFGDILNDELKGLLEACNYHNPIGVRFDLEDYDVVVSGHLKKSQGKGFRAYLNTIVAIAIQNCLDKYNKYQPHLLVVDSPIMSLKEKGDDRGEEQASETMKVGLFRYLLDHQAARQTIIIENVPPKLDYGKTNMIEFTRDESRERYGLIKGYTE